MNISLSIDAFGISPLAKQTSEKLVTEVENTLEVSNQFHMVFKFIDS